MNYSFQDVEFLKVRLNLWYSSAMNRDQIIAHIRRRQNDIKAEGVTSLYLFGSRARGDEDDLSDLDVFIEYDSALPFSLFELVSVKHIVEDELGLPVDVIPRQDLKRIKQAAERDAIQVF